MRIAVGGIVACERWRDKSNTVESEMLEKFQGSKQDDIQRRKGSANESAKNRFNLLRAGILGRGCFAGLIWGAECDAQHCGAGETQLLDGQ